MSEHRDIVPDPNGFVIDLSKPPYEVPCPVCKAWALEACRTHEKQMVETEFVDSRSLIASLGIARSERIFSWPKEARILPHAHDARQKHWEEHPEFRVKAIG
jgi:hypothetical protein